MTHTPGPWTVGERLHGSDVRVDANGGPVAQVRGHVYVGSTPTRRPVNANARLIAASPELLEALEEVMRECVTVGGFPERGKGRTDAQQVAYDKARAAIDKAKGG